VFAAAGTVSLQCSATSATASNIKLAAIRTGTLTNSG
jgi:hypothetical protein